MRIHVYFILFYCFLMLAGCSSNQTDHPKIEITVSAAASLTDVLLEIKKEFELQEPSIHVQVNFGSSGSLQKQIQQGAPVDLYISASKLNFQEAMTANLVEPSSAITLLTNQLVLATPKDTTLSINDFSDLANSSVKKIAIGIPETVPAGQYAKELLTTLNLWNNLENKLVLAKDVRQVLTYLETGNVNAGIVYLSDAINSDKIHIIKTVEQNLHSPINYQAGILTSSNQRGAAETFLYFLKSSDSTELFEKYGFEPVNK
ncbi:molybdate ABC transporter substrate-binding protein [Litchfieldia alkalitelluris]|uniref:molybdate ABC transporter substrate-binding protein n=1 Tax=Litchfieldia alkalitelluris TaxID=304268 RepID=UPI00099681D7|nr:molybdate ABC transporter substrate-binding protein [Litchfieldia alkalitelluris]